MSLQVFESHWLLQTFHHNGQDRYVSSLTGFLPRAFRRFLFESSLKLKVLVANSFFLPITNKMTVNIIFLSSSRDRSIFSNSKSSSLKLIECNLILPPLRHILAGSSISIFATAI